jgi:nucleotide-binding universal stress UspA family protein
MYTRILIPLDGSKTAENVLPYARTIGKTLKIPIELMGVVDIADMAAHISAEKDPHLDRLMIAAEQNRKTYLDGIAQSFSGVSLKCIIERGNPEDVIIERAATDKNTLIAMATHGRSGMNRWLLGSVTEKVLRGASNPLLLVRAAEEAKTDGEAKVKSVLVPLDGSELAEKAMPKAKELAKALNLEIILFRAYELPAAAYYGSEDYLPNYEELAGQVKEGAKSYLDAKVAALKAEGLEKVSMVLMEGPGPDEIISFARKSPDTLVAMCTHGRSGVKRWMLGSVTEKVVRHSGDPVLVVRAA